MKRKWIVGMAVSGLVAVPVAALAASGGFSQESAWSTQQGQVTWKAEGKMSASGDPGQSDPTNSLNSLPDELKKGQAQLEEQLQKGKTQLEEHLEKGHFQLQQQLKEGQEQIQQGMGQGRQELEKALKELQEKLANGGQGQMPSLPELPQLPASPGGGFPGQMLALPELSGAPAPGGNSSIKGGGTLKLILPGFGTISGEMMGSGSTEGAKISIVGSSSHP
ncbi:hypothetical protein [Effusibacillus lacus]|uniref:Uncharacterized protein n=1 Tax=Effusibacillus lacus TaxID=1348429 RepID=A0A292YP82_9BACL|nr:hypothetical protein [Effusibacillus lacus]TCS68165.1 hypothetical protein EDD64_14517 [Effusibacillus lacus]GAX90295.1 hypothetical protein EFBL_1921 [Effusibacillus lacus]